MREKQKGVDKEAKQHQEGEGKKGKNRLRKGLLKHGQFFPVWSVFWRKIQSLQQRCQINSAQLLFFKGSNKKRNGVGKSGGAVCSLVLYL